MVSSDGRCRGFVHKDRFLTSPLSKNLGWRVLIPGLTQLTWNQHERGLVYLVSFLASLATSLFCWGNPLGWGFLAFCFLAQIAAYKDVVRQRTFRSFRARLRWPRRFWVWV